MLRALDIFCGGGGSSHGASMAGFEVAAGVDMDPVATATFRANFPNSIVITKKLEDIPLWKFREQVGRIDLLMASPECTNHSCAKGAKPKSEESRATAMQLVRYARNFSPRWICMENVVHMKPWPRYRELINELTFLGYQLREQVIDAADLGVPQSRRRLFVFGELNFMPPPFEYEPVARRGTVWDILDQPGTHRESPLDNGRRAKDTLARAERAFADIGHDTPFLLVYYGSDGAGGYQTLDRPLRTVTTHDRFALVRPTVDGPMMRMLQPSELRKAMGFNDDYKLTVGTRTNKIRLLGNGVCPPVMARVVKHLTSAQTAERLAA
ncbi:MAG: DNA cytosine methyltransferase [Rhodospirillaceae bacterium]